MKDRRQLADIHTGIRFVLTHYDICHFYLIIFNFRDKVNGVGRKKREVKKKTDALIDLKQKF